jgi:hypothetical protein
MQGAFDLYAAVSTGKTKSCKDSNQKGLMQTKTGEAKIASFA